MWSTFALAIVLGVFSLYVPGFFIIRAARAGWFPAFVGAPLVSILVFNALALVYKAIGVSCSWLTVVLPTLIVGVLAYFASYLIGRKTYSVRSWGLNDPVRIGRKDIKHFNIYALTAYVVMGVMLTVYAMVSCLDGPSSYVQEFDNVHHLDMIKNFAASGEWSVFSTDYYKNTTDSPFVTSGGGFYPTSWIMIAAMLCDALGSEPALAENATNFTFIAFVLPISMYGLLRHLFKDKPTIALCGAICTLAFAAFPWQLLTFGPIYPNAAAYALVPAVVLFFMLIFKPGEGSYARILAATVTFIGVATLALTQPNAVFTAVVCLLPWCMYASAKATERLSLQGAKRLQAKVAAAAGFFAFAAIAWVVMLHVPFFQGVLSEWWYAYTGKFQALADAATLQFVGNSWQPLLAMLVVAGALYAVLRREYLWLVFAYLIFCFMFVVDASTEWELKRWLTGFWYTDKYRIAAAAALCGIPLACMGLYAACWGAKSLATKAAREDDRFGPAVASFAVVAAIAVVIYYPTWTVNGQPAAATAFGLFRDSYEAANSASDARPYSKAEQGFVEKVKGVLPEGEAVLNVPHDGSAFAFSQNDLIIFYRCPRGYEPNVEKPESALVRQSLSEVASNPEVAEAVRGLGVEYVLLLDVKDGTPAEPFLFTYEEQNWQGMSSINDDTPGFEVVLAEGDMRLYRISAMG